MQSYVLISISIAYLFIIWHDINTTFSYWYVTMLDFASPYKQ